VVCHEGPYQKLGRTYDFIYGQWLPTSGRVPGNSPPFEVYLNAPDSTDSEDLLTDLHVPLKDRS
jgi:AraC family transcriptional regulator